MKSEDWPSATLRSIAADRGLIGGPFGSSLGTNDYVVDGVPVIRGGNLSERPFVAAGLVFVSDEKADSLSRCLAQPGDIVATQRGTLGQIGRIPRGSYPRWLISQSQMALRVDPTLADPDFVYQSLLSPRLQQQIQDRAIVTGVPHINLGIFGELEIPYPPVHEQRRISGLLGALDDKIDSNRRVIDVAGATSRLIYERATGGEENGARLGDVADVVDCLHSRKPIARDNGQLLLQLANIREDGLLDLGSQYLISDTDYENWTRRMEARRGDCVITNVGRVGAAARIPGIRAALGRNMTGMRVRDSWPHPACLIEALLSTRMRRAIELLTDAGTIMNALNVRNIPRLSVPKLDAAGWTALESELEPIWAFREALLAESLTLAATRDALLPKLVSGAIRVPDTADNDEVIGPLVEAAS